MDGQQLVNMANRIGDFFASMPDHTEALADIAGHIRRTWEPRMRRQLLALLDTPNAAALTSIVQDALRTHRASLTPADN